MKLTGFSTSFSYVSVTDLHLVPASLGGSINGTSLAAITTDIDGNTRSATLPYRGADELAAGLFKTLHWMLVLKAMPGGPSNIVTVGLAGNASPHSLIALATETVNGGTLQGRYYFGGTDIAKRNFLLSHRNRRNHLETWRSRPITSQPETQAITYYSTFTGIRKQSGHILRCSYSLWWWCQWRRYNRRFKNGADVDNDAFNFVSGNQRLTDVTNDQTTDASDAAITDNNAFNFIGVVTPPSPNGISGKGLMSETNSRTTKVTRNLKQVGTSF